MRALRRLRSLRVLSLLISILIVFPAAAIPARAAGTPGLQIEYLGHSAFILTYTTPDGLTTTRLLTDPWSMMGYPPAPAYDPLVSDGINYVTVSHLHEDHNCTDAAPGATVISGTYRNEQYAEVFQPITGMYGPFAISNLETVHAGGGPDTPNSVFMIDVDGHRIVHLGDAFANVDSDAGFTADEINALTNGGAGIDVLMLPVSNAMDAIAVARLNNVIAQLNPKVVLTMHSWGLAGNYLNSPDCGYPVQEICASSVQYADPVAATPVIWHLLPSIACLDRVDGNGLLPTENSSSLTLVGENLRAGTIQLIPQGGGPVTVTPTSSSATSVTVTVPAGLTPGYYSVQMNMASTPDMRASYAFLPNAVLIAQRPTMTGVSLIGSTAAMAFATNVSSTLTADDLVVTGDGAPLAPGAITAAGNQITVGLPSTPTKVSIQVKPTAAGKVCDGIGQTLANAGLTFYSASPTITASAPAFTLGDPVAATFADDATWRESITGFWAGGTYIAKADFGSNVTFGAGTLSLAGALFPSANDYFCTVEAAGYPDAAFGLTITDGAAPVPVAGTVADATVAMGSPTTVDPSNNTFAIDITGLGQTANAALTTGDYLVTTSLPGGLLPDGLSVQAAVTPATNHIVFTLSGTASAPVAAPVAITVTLLPGAANEAGLTASSPISGITLAPYVADPPTLQSIEISGTINAHVGDSQLTAIGHYSDTSSAPIPATWSSDNPSLASVDGAGTVAVQPGVMGTATVTANVGGITATTSVTVNAAASLLGGSPAADVIVDAVSSPSGLQVQLYRDAMYQYDLAAPGSPYSTASVFTVQVKTDSEPFLVLGCGDIKDWSWAANGAGPDGTLTIHVAPLSQVYEIQADPAHGIDYQRGIYGGAVTLLVVSDDVLGSGGAYRGGSFSTNGNNFAPPQMVGGRVTMNVGGVATQPGDPQGTFKAFVPPALLTAWGISSPAQLTAELSGAGAQAVTPTVTEVAGGMELAFDMHFSSWTVSIGPKQAAGAATADNSIAMGTATTVGANNTFTVHLTTGTPKNGALAADSYTVTGLPSGLTVSAVGSSASGDIVFTVGGTASSSVLTGLPLSVVVKAAATTDAAVDSLSIGGLLLQGASVAPVLAPDASGNAVGAAIDVTFSDNASWRSAVTSVSIDGNTITDLAGQGITLSAGKLTIPASLLTTAKTYSIRVVATGYTDAIVLQSITAALPPLPPVPPVEPPVVPPTGGSTITTPTGTTTTQTNSDGTVDVVTRVDASLVNPATLGGDLSLDLTGSGSASGTITERTAEVPVSVLTGLAATPHDIVLNAGIATITVPPTAFTNLTPVQDAAASGAASLRLSVEPIDTTAGGADAGSSIDATLIAVRESLSGAAATGLTPAGRILAFTADLTSADGTTTRLTHFAERLTVRIPFDPSANPDLLGVYRLNRITGQWEYRGGRINREEGYIEIELDGFSEYAIMTCSVTFPDVAGHWAASDIATLAARHIVGGNGTGFAPEANITRAEFAAMIIRALGLSNTTASAKFSDVKAGDWFAQVVATAADAGLVTGDAGRFRPNDAISRQEMAVILSRVLALKSKSLSLDATAVSARLAAFGDASAIADWARAQAAEVNQAGLINGRTTATFAPVANATRAEVAAVVVRLLRVLGDL